MAEPKRIGVALLAAGASKRFGDSDKLAADLHGRSLGEYAAEALPFERCSQAWVIVSQSGHSCEAAWRAYGLSPVLNEEAGRGMGTSVALAARLAKEARCDGVVIALADMPFVLREHFDALLSAFEQGAAIAASAKDQTRLPPAIFAAACFDEMQQSQGDSGARNLIQSGQIVACPPETLVDIDTEHDLRRYGQEVCRPPTDYPKGR